MQSNKNYISHAAFTPKKVNNKTKKINGKQAKQAKANANKAKQAKPAPNKAANVYSTDGVLYHTINDRWMPGQDEIIRDISKSLINSLPYDDRNPVSKMIIDEIILPRYIVDNDLSEFIKTDEDKEELMYHLLDHSVGTNDAYIPSKKASSGYCSPRICFIENNNKVIIVKQVMDKDDYDYFAKLGFEINNTNTESNQSGEGYHAIVNVKRSFHQSMLLVEQTNCEQDETITMSIVTTKEGLIDTNNSKLYINKSYVGRKSQGKITNNAKIAFGDKFIPDFNDANKFVELNKFNHPINLRLQDIDYPELAGFKKFLELRDNDCFDNEHFYDEVNKMIISEPTREKEFYETSKLNRMMMNGIKIHTENGVVAYNYISAKSSGIMSCKTASGFFNMLNSILRHYKCRLFIDYKLDSIDVNLVNYSTIAGLVLVSTKINSRTCEYSTTMKQDSRTMAEIEQKDLVKNSWRLSALVTGYMSCNWIGTFPDIKYATVNKIVQKDKTKNKTRTMIDNDNERLDEILSDYKYDLGSLFEEKTSLLK